MELKDIISSGILELYCSGLTSKEEEVQVHEWIKQFPSIKNEIDEIERSLEEYALTYALKPDKSVKQKIFERIAGKSDKEVPAPVMAVGGRDVTGSVYAIPAYYKWAIAASVILLAGSLVFNFTYYNKLRFANINLQVVQNELAKQKELTAGMSKDINVVTDKNALPVVLNGTPHAPTALAKIFWMKNTGDVYVDPTYLPSPAAGKQYQLWAIVNGKPVDGGMISTGKAIFKIQKMKSFGKAEAFAITLEKAGGSPTPTMQELYVMAEIKI